MYNYYDFENVKLRKTVAELKKTVEELKSQQETYAGEVVSLKSMLDELKEKQENPDNTFAELTLSLFSCYVKELDKSYGISICSNCGAKGHDITKCTEECKGNCPRSFKSHIPCKCPFQKVNSLPPNDEVSLKDGDLVEPTPTIANGQC